MDKQIQTGLPDKILSEAVQPARQAIRFRMPEMKRPGHTIYEYDIEADKLVSIDAVEKNLIKNDVSKNAIDAQQNSVQHKFKARLNCIYVQALNVKNAWKKVNKAMNQDV